MTSVRGREDARVTDGGRAEKIVGPRGSESFTARIGRTVGDATRGVALFMHIADSVTDYLLQPPASHPRAQAQRTERSCVSFALWKIYRVDL